MQIDKSKASSFIDYLDNESTQVKKLTLRLDDKDRMMLDKIKSRFNIKSDNKFFKTMIKWMFYEGLSE